MDFMLRGWKHQPQALPRRAKNHRRLRRFPTGQQRFQPKTEASIRTKLYAFIVTANYVAKEVLSGKNHNARALL